MAGRMLIRVCAVLMAIAVATAASGEAGSVVAGLARCADCTRENMKAEAAFKGLQVAIKCKNNGEYESKAVCELQSSGAFSVPLATDLHGADCFAQLHSAAGTPCPGQEPSKIVPVAESSFVAVPGKTHYPSAECASAFLCAPIKQHFFDHFHKKPVPEHQPAPEYHPVPEHKPAPEYHPPTPEYYPPMPEYHPPTLVYGQPKSTPIYHPPVQH